MIPFAHEILCISRQALEAQVLRLEFGRVRLSIEEFASHRVDTAGLQLVDGLVYRLLKHTNQVRFDAHGL